MSLWFLRFYELFGVLVVVQLYGLSHFLQMQDYHTKSIRKFVLRDRFDILFETRLGGVVEQGFA